MLDFLQNFRVLRKVVFIELLDIVTFIDAIVLEVVYIQVNRFDMIEGYQFSGIIC